MLLFCPSLYFFKTLQRVVACRLLRGACTFFFADFRTRFLLWLDCHRVRQIQDGSGTLTLKLFFHKV